MTRWALTEGEYSSYGIVGILRDEATARKLEADLAATEGRHKYQVESFDDLDDVTVRTVTHFSHQDVVAFDGSTNGGYPSDEEHLWTEAIVGVVPSYDVVSVRRFPTTYGAGTREPGGMRLAIRLSVTGVDIERCRKVWTEQHAQLLAAPAISVIECWREDLAKGYHTDGGAFYINHPDNGPIAAALRSALAAS